MKLIVKLKEKKSEEILNEIRKICKISHIMSLTNYIGIEIEEKRLKDLKKLDFVEEVREPGIAKAMLSSAASETGIVDLLEKGVYGENTIISLIDSGVDLLYPDIAYYVRSAEDFTGEGFYDFLGHGRIIAI
ncbi:MAG: hypothetical protein ACE5KT_03045 [Methanosarcinales archaeon]